MEDCPLARRYRWRVPRDKQARSLEWFLERDAPKKLNGHARELTEFQKERRLFHKLRAERAGERKEGVRNEQTSDGGTIRRGTVVQEAAS